MARSAPSKSPPAVVLGLNLTALGTIRALARRGIAVTAIATREGRVSEYTRYGTKLFDARVDADACVDVLEELGPRFAEPPVLFASSDAHCVVMSAHRERLAAWYRYVYPERDVFATLMDKGRLALWAREHGFAVPGTVVVTEGESCREAAQALRFPCVLKPTLRSSVWTHKWPKTMVLDTREALEQVYPQIADDAPGYIVQEIIPGGDDDIYFCLVYLDRGGEVRARYGVRKIRQQPPLYGTASLAVSWPQDEVAEAAVALLQRAGYRGIGSVEFKRDPRDGRLYVMEATVGRVDLNCPLATAAGVNIPYLAYCDAAELPLPELHVVRPGLKWCNERDDFAAAGQYRRHGDLSLAAWLRSLRGPCTYATWARDDPLPFVLLSLGFSARAVGIRSRWW